MRRLFLSSLMLFGAPAAMACSCVVDDVEQAERDEYERADLVFNGYLMREQLSPMAPCVPGEVDPNDFSAPRATFKVLHADKGVEDGEVIVANLTDHPWVHYDTACDLISFGNSCQTEFERSYYGSAARPIWMAFKNVEGELWSLGPMCSAFSGDNGARVVAKYSKRDKS